MKCGGCDRGLNNSASPRGKSLGCRPWPWLPPRQRRQTAGGSFVGCCVCVCVGGVLRVRRRPDKHVPVVVVYPLHILMIRTPCTFQIVAVNVLLHLQGLTASFTTVCRQTRRAGIHLQLQLFSFLVHLPSSQENQLPITHPTASPLLLCFRQQNNKRVRMSAHV